MVYIHKGLFLLMLHVHPYSALTLSQIFILGFRLKQLLYLGYAGLVAKGKNNDDHVWKLLKESAKWQMSISFIFYWPKQDTWLSLKSVGLEI